MTSKGSGNARRIGLLLGALVLAALLLHNQNAVQQEYGEEWWNGSWHYRVKIDVSTESMERTDWPVEYEANFTSLLNDLGVSGEFDPNSTRVLEVNSSGGILREVPSQFDPALDYNSTSNAAGELVFMLNGTNAPGTTRWFYVYFDTTSHAKSGATYDSELEAQWDGEEFNITFNNQDTEHYGFFAFDTERGENTSGLYQFRLYDTWRFTYPNSNQKTREYIRTTDGSSDFGYDLRDNATMVDGPARVTVRQEGYEVYFGEADNRTNKTYIRKTYYFYPNKTWFVVEQEILNINGSSVDRASYAGLSGFDLEGAYGIGYKWLTNYTQDPGSYVSGGGGTGVERVGYANLWENSTSNFMAGNSTDGGSPDYDLIGINLSMTTIEPGESIRNRFVMVFYHTVNSPTLLPDTMRGLMNGVSIAEEEPEMWVITAQPEPDHGIYNRNESAILVANVTRDDWYIVDHANATLDMGTPGSSADDITVSLRDDGACPDQAAGDGYHSAYYNFSDSEATGEWNMTVRLYDRDGAFLNESYYTFNITDVLELSIDIWNVTGIWRVENATVNVTNYMQDIQVPGATLNCTSNQGQIPQENITDNGDGTYVVTFETPLDYGLYPLNCSAQKDGSWGWQLENYTVEAPETNISLTTDPSLYHAYNVTYFSNESFGLKVTLRNLENSTAYWANITLDVPGNLTSNSTLETCGENLLIGLTCVRHFNITVLNNTINDTYQIGVTINWTNRVGTQDSNTTAVDVIVHETPTLNVLEENVTGILPPGANSQKIETLVARSDGNNRVYNINFTKVGLGNFTIGFSPQETGMLGPGESQPVEVTVTVPEGQFPGIYYGFINATSDNGGYDVLNTTIIVTGTNLTINASPETYSAMYVTAFTNESMEIAVNVTNIGNTTAFNTYVNMTFPGNWYINETSHSCGNMTRGSTCMSYYYINITELTHAGSYDVEAMIFWEDIGISWFDRNDTVNVTVVSNATLEVLEDQFVKTMEHDNTSLLGELTLRSTGNDDLSDVNFSISGIFSEFVIGFNKSYPFTMAPGDVFTVRVNATTYPGFSPGDYDGYINVTSSNDGYKPVELNITVPQNGSWTMNTTFCEHAQSPNSGTVCDVLINNTGNIMLNFTIEPPAGANHTTPSNATLNISKQSSDVLSIFYDMGTEAGEGFFFTNYTVAPNQSAGEPGNLILSILLNPFVEPLVEIGLTPPDQQQAGSTAMVINVTSQSGAEFDDVRLTVQRPDGTNDTMLLGFSHQVFWYGCDFSISDPGDKLCFQVTYPGTLPGNTSERGNYTVFVYANDTYRVNTTNTSTLRIFTRYMANVNMPDVIQGSWESIEYRATDYLGAALPYASVNLTVKDPNNRIVYMLSGKEYTADEQGWVGDNIFVIPGHATEGEYRVLTNGSWTDPDLGMLVSNETEAMFNVTANQELTGKVAVPSPIYMDNTMTVSVIVLENLHEPVDPDEINVTIYYTEGYGLQEWRTLDLSDFNRTQEGFYEYSEVLSSVLTGSYLALLRVSLGERETYDIQPFRVASGGPYDVILDLGESEVQQGSTLPFDITIWNKGEVDHKDVVATYWVYGSGQSWDSSSFSTNIVGGQNKTFGRTSFIYSNQPPGLYTLNAEVLYDPNQPPATANATFLVTSTAEEDEGGGGGGAPAPGGAAPAAPRGTLNITEAPDVIGAMVGLPKLFSIEVEAVGGPVTGVELDFQGIPESWVTVEPVNLSRISSGGTAIFTVQLLVPRGESGDRKVKVVARSKESTDDSDFTLRIFTSRQDLISFELARLRAKLEELRERSRKAAEAGFDTGRVDDTLDDAEREIELAEQYLREELYDASLESVYTAWKLLDKAEDLLDLMLAGFSLPWWLIVIIIFALVTVVLFFLYRKISRNLSVMVRGRLSEARQVAGTIKGSGAEVDSLRDEKARVTRMLKLLETQHKQGIISKEAYDSLRKRSEQRLGDIDKKIRQSLSG